MTRISSLPFVACALLLAAGLALAPGGYDDAPFLPGGEWRVHDPRRPPPRVVTPGATPGAPPSDAVVLFDGTTLDAWEGAKGGDAKWRLVDGAMEVNGTGSIRTKATF